MEASPARPQGVSSAFLELVGRALTDDQFRELLYNDRSAAVADYDLTEADEEALDQLTREKLEEQAEVLTHSSQVAISIVVRVKF